MPDPRNVLQSKFAEADRYANFGDLIVNMRVRGFRCHTDTIVQIESPITAFSGLNGTGKSTLIQLAATAYKDPDASQSFTIRDFMVRSALDQHPYSPGASVRFDYWTDRRRTKPATLSRNIHDNRWNGYRYRPTGKVFFAGIGLYLPKVESRDFLVRYARSFRVLDAANVSSELKDWTCRILGHSYDAVVTNEVGHSASFPGTKVISVVRHGHSYSETHMGFGEGRAQFMIHALEALPDKSLVLLEEPETSLHPGAQHEFGKYLVDASIRKGHQILLTTHSEYLLRSLHSASRIYLHLDAGNLRQIQGLTASQATSLMTDGRDKALNILVEDDCAKAIVTEMVRRYDVDFLRTIGVSSAGDYNSIRTTMRCLQESGIQVAAVLDGDQNATPRHNIFTLPGSQAPEKELFLNPNVTAHILEKYDIIWADYHAGRGLQNVDHHEWLRGLAVHISLDEQSLTRELARAYAETQDCASFTRLLREAISV